MGNAEALRNYEKAVLIGAYDRFPGGLFGKFDNVRRYWEDQITHQALSEFLGPFVESKRQTLSRLRVIDLGCGSGAGYEILTNLRWIPHDPYQREVLILPPEMLSCYRGVDISPAMIEKAKEIYAGNPKTDFIIADLNEGLPVDGEPPYDIYFSSYGSLSHLPDDSLRRLLEDICDHMDESAIFIADVLGRYSYEWQRYWDDSEDGSMMRPYCMSYIYPPDLRHRVEVEFFPIRFWGGKEFDRFVEETVTRKGVQIVRRHLRDRSVLVGRHMDTREFNPYAQPLRSAVNSLFEFNRRTDLSHLIFDYHPHPHHPELNDFFEEFQMAWNAVVYACEEALRHWDQPHRLRDDLLDNYPRPVQVAIQTIREVVKLARTFRMGDPVANIVERQLAWLLLEVEQSLQRGLGTAHALLAFYEFRKV